MYSIVNDNTIGVELLVVPTNGALSRLIESIDSDFLPSIDVEVILTLAIDALIYKHGVNAEMQVLLRNINELDDSICHCLKSDKDNIPSSVIEAILMALMALVDNVYACMCNNDMYVNDFLNFEFARIADNDNLLLRRVGGR